MLLSLTRSIVESTWIIIKRFWLLLRECRDISERVVGVGAPSDCNCEPAATESGERCSLAVSRPAAQSVRAVFLEFAECVPTVVCSAQTRLFCGRAAPLCAKARHSATVRRWRDSCLFSQLTLIRWHGYWQDSSFCYSLLLFTSNCFAAPLYSYIIQYVNSSRTLYCIFFVNSLIDSWRLKVRFIH